MASVLRTARDRLAKTGNPWPRPASLSSLLPAVLGILLLTSLQPGRAYPKGAGTAACGDESPQVCHKAQPQANQGPYQIVVQGDTYSPGIAVSVAIQTTNSSMPFIGFLLGAHTVGGNVSTYYGSFGATNEYQPRCGANGNSGATHTSSEDKQNVTLQWMPPGIDSGELHFTCAFVYQFDIYWVNVTSKGTLKPVGYPSNESTSISPQTTSSGPAPSSLKKDPDCGVTKSCYGDCRQDGTCTFLTTWYKADQSLVITLNSVVPSGDDDYWLAIGFGTKTSMNDASVTDCVVYGGQMQAFQSFNSDYDNARVTPDPRIGLSNATGSLSDGIMTCTVRRNLVIGGGSDVYNLTMAKYHILLSRGRANEWNKLPHEAGDDYVTAGRYDVSEIVDIGAQKVDYPLVRLHGCLMTLAWLLCSSVGVLVARFYKVSWPMQKICGVHIWFAIHRALMTTVLLTTAAGFIVIFIHVQGLSKIIGPEYKQIHPILGIIVTVLTIVNPAMALFRCDPAHKDRPVFNWAHWFVGTSSFILGVVTVAIGTTMPALSLPTSVTYTVISFGAWLVFIHSLLEVVCWLERKDSMVGVYRDMQSFSASMDGIKYQYHRHILLALHIIVSLSVTIAVTAELIGF